MKRFPFIVATLLLGLFLSPAFALPELQLGPGSGSWSYDLVSSTWQGSGNPLELAAYANAERVDGGSGAYAWDSRFNDTRIAYLGISAMPQTTLNELPSLFDVTIVNDGMALALYSSGNGVPPLSDPRGLGPHDIFPTYFEIYEFGFDGSLGTIGNSQPGETCHGPCQGYTERFGITLHSLAPSVTGLHFDLFTIRGDGSLNGTSRVYRNAPFTHDAESVPEPTAAAMLLIGLGGLGWVGHRTRTR